ncbi:hypothetical protein BO71DRAFT_435307 [Aspergillus ellipticus CBS 707.79]|uniref:Uncharacterized protein n=1 Tax=Aspergillus ellipticus CBS 707.79 TaxID=1448320 RepID=A0A319CUR2_9EURO|nr:hypothetical protein BO71DRAFT_435307 [Aspergillus ellipticus CBS 707.79]
MAACHVEQETPSPATGTTRLIRMASMELLLWKDPTDRPWDEDEDEDADADGDGDDTIQSSPLSRAMATRSLPPYLTTSAHDVTVRRPLSVYASTGTTTTLPDGSPTLAVVGTDPAGNQTPRNRGERKTSENYLDSSWQSHPEQFGVHYVSGGIGAYFKSDQSPPRTYLGKTPRPPSSPSNLQDSRQRGIWISRGLAQVARAEVPLPARRKGAARGGPGPPWDVILVFIYRIKQPNGDRDAGREKDTKTHQDVQRTASDANP